MTPKLSVRQAEVAALVAKGLPDKQIAARTGLSIKTVQVHVQAAAAKLDYYDGSPRRRLTLWFFDIPADNPK